MDTNKQATNSTRHDAAPGPSIRSTAAWPATSAETLIELWNAGRTAAQIAKRLSVSVRAVESKLRKLRAAGHDLVRRRARVAQRAGRAGRARRRCLHCGAMFASAHPGNRICLVCLDEGPFTSALV